MSDAGQLEAQVVQVELALQKLEKKEKQSRSNFVGGFILLVIGVVLLLVTTGLLFWIGAFLAILGGLGLLSGILGRISNASNRKKLEEALVQARAARAVAGR